MATYVNAIYLPVPLALTQPTPAEVAEILHNPYSVGFDGAFPLLRREAVELTLEQIFVTFAAQVRAVSTQAGVPPEQLKLAQVARAIVGRPAVDPGVKHDLQVTKPIVPCNTQSALDDAK